jgi:hypothetical protein
MSYASQDQLAYDIQFMSRNRACVTQQAETYQASGDPQVKALANAALRQEGGIINTFTNMAAAGPGIAEKVGDPPDQSLVTDEDILALTQANWIPVAQLYFDAEGNRLPL